MENNKEYYLEEIYGNLYLKKLPKNFDCKEYPYIIQYCERLLHAHGIFRYFKTYYTKEENVYIDILTKEQDNILDFGTHFKPKKEEELKVNIQSCNIYGNSKFAKNFERDYIFNSGKLEVFDYLQKRIIIKKEN